MTENHEPRHFHSSWARMLVVVSMALATVACGPSLRSPGSADPISTLAATRGPLPSAAYFVPGETMRFEFRFRGILVGRAALAVGQPGSFKGRPALIVRSEVETTGVGRLVKVIHDDTRSWIDTASGRVIEQHAEMVFGKRDLIVDAHFAGNQVSIEYEHRRKPDTTPPAARAPAARAPARTGATTPSAPAPSARSSATRSGFVRVLPGKRDSVRVRVRRRVPSGQNRAQRRRHRSRMRYAFPAGEFGRDAHAVLGSLRAFHGPEGSHLHFYGVSGRFIWRNELVYKGTEVVRTSMGLYSALRFDGVATRLDRKLMPHRTRAQRTYTLWLSDDHKRVPLRVLGKTEYGDVAIELVDYHAPTRASVAAAR